MGVSMGRHLSRSMCGGQRTTLGVEAGSLFCSLLCTQGQPLSFRGISCLSSYPSNCRNITKSSFLCRFWDSRICSSPVRHMISHGAISQTYVCIYACLYVSHLNIFMCSIKIQEVTFLRLYVVMVIEKYSLAQRSHAIPTCSSVLVPG